MIKLGRNALFGEFLHIPRGFRVAIVTKRLRQRAICGTTTAVPETNGWHVAQ